MNREEVVVATLSEGLGPESYELRVRCDEGFLARFPGGFTPVPRADDDMVFEVCPERVVHHGRDLLDAQFAEFCRAIRAWQHGSAMNFMTGLSAETIVFDFMATFQREGFVLAMVAAHANLSMEQFLGALRPKDIGGTISP